MPSSATREQELTRLKKELDRLEAEIAKRTVEHLSTENLYRLSDDLKDKDWLMPPSERCRGFL